MDQAAVALCRLTGGNRLLMEGWGLAAQGRGWNAERQRDEHDPSYRKCGFEASVMGPFREGAPITLAQKRAA